VIRIGAGQGAFGESAELLHSSFRAGVDYVVCDSLAETTCGFFALDRRRDEGAGFAPDLAARLDLALPYVVERGTKLVTNAGGFNPIAAHQRAVAAARAAGASGIKIGVVEFGRPVAPRRDRDPQPFAEQVYLGAAGVVAALERGADIVITGRVADAALFLAPLVHEYGWAWDDWDRLAAGVVVGHLLECSGQAMGGNYSGDWWNLLDFTRIGLPIAEVDADGTAVITKPAGTSGRVSFDTVREQLLYEVHDPAAYVSPDVVVDLTAVELVDLADDRVVVTGARGAPRPAQLKGLTFALAGYAGEVVLTYSWPDAEAKCRHVLASLRDLAAAREIPVSEWHEELFGVGGFGGPTLDVDDRPHDPPEVTARLAWRTETRDAAAAVPRLVSMIVLSSPAGLQGIGRRSRGAAAGPAELLGIEPFFVDRDEVEPDVHVHVEEVRA
jgi:hypothetical protein